MIKGLSMERPAHRLASVMSGRPARRRAPMTPTPVSTWTRYPGSCGTFPMPVPDSASRTFC
jgi:hypothetical protein